MAVSHPKEIEEKSYYVVIIDNEKNVKTFKPLVSTWQHVYVFCFRWYIKLPWSNVVDKNTNKVYIISVCTCNGSLFFSFVQIQRGLLLLKWFDHGLQEHPKVSYSALLPWATQILKEEFPYISEGCCPTRYLHYILGHWLLTITYEIKSKCIYIWFFLRFPICSIDHNTDSKNEDKQHILQRNFQT